MDIGVKFLGILVEKILNIIPKSKDELFYDKALHRKRVFLLHG